MKVFALSIFKNNFIMTVFLLSLLILPCLPSSCSIDSAPIDLTTQPDQFQLTKHGWMI